jgi:hypothetical protein
MSESSAWRRGSSRRRRRSAWTCSPATATRAVVAPDAPPPPVPPPPASDAQLAQWRDAVSSKGLGAALPLPPTAQRPWGINHEMMCLLGPPDVELNDSAAVLDELDALEEVATDERQKLWVRFHIDVQKHWLSHLVARTRTLREHPALDGVMDRLKTIRAVYPQWTRDYVPGHIHGLQLKHAPVGGAWARDAEDHWRALGEALGPDVARRVVRSAPKKRKPVRSLVEDEPAVVPPDWPLMPLVRGKVAVPVGGVPKEPNRERLEAYLRLATLEWPLVDGPRKVAAVAQRIARGAYDLVVVNQALISHPEAEQVLGAAKGSRTRWAIVDGYGVTAVQHGIERFLQGPGETAKH